MGRLIEYAAVLTATVAFCLLCVAYIVGAI